eukprot:9471915-Pyramimonas_sp.AAC.1
MAGRRPARKWGGADFSDDEHYGAMFKAEPTLPRRVALAQIKGDWAELCSTLGFPNWQTKWAPCLFCRASRDELYNFSHLTLTTHEWGTYGPGSYEASCEAREIRVTLRTEADRVALLRHLEWDKSKQRIGGRACKDECPRFGLQKKDRLEPSGELPDVGLLSTTPIPAHGLNLIFWRRAYIATAPSDPVHRRNPLLSSAVIGNVRSVLRADTLHTLYLG